MSENLQNWDACLAVASLSDIGMRRSNNQDNLSISLASSLDQWKRRGHLFIVADGMGAHAAGELASKLAVDHIPHLYGKYDDLPAHEALRKSVVDANTEIHRRGQANEEFHNMGTTCSALLLMPSGAIVAHVGDSRVYRMRNNHLEQLTFDHSLVWEMRKSGQLSEAELESGKIPRNVITRSLGPYAESKVDLEGPFPIMVHDKFLLCTDGLTGLVNDDELGLLISNLPPDEAARALIDLANLRGGHDNITCIIVEIKHPLLATTPESHMVSKEPRTSRGFPLQPVSIAVLVASAAVAVVFYLLGEKGIALIPAIVFLFSLAWIIINLIRAVRTDGSRSNIQSLGEAPYSRQDCASGKELVVQLKDMTGKLIGVAEKQGWDIDQDQLAQLVKTADGAIGSGAVHAYARCISFLMDQFRNQA